MHTNGSAIQCTLLIMDVLSKEYCAVYSSVGMGEYSINFAERGWRAIETLQLGPLSLSFLLLAEWSSLLAIMVSEGKSG